MARKTKEEAQATRAQLLDAAERVFHLRGVSRTSLQEIAQEAGLTRGAIYWHFENKADLFHAMMQRVTLPMATQIASAADATSTDPLDALRRSVASAFHLTVHDEQVRRVFEIATHKVEYIEELQALRQQHINDRNGYTLDLQGTLQQAQRMGQVRKGLDLATTAVGLHALISGLMQNWLLAPDAFDLEATGMAVLDTYLAGLAPHAKG